MYNAETVKQLFDEHAVLFFDQEAVVFHDAVDIFGIDAVEAAHDADSNKENFPYFFDKNKDIIALFVSYQGFQLIATYANILELHGGVSASRPKSQAKAKTKNRRKRDSTNVIDICKVVSAANYGNAQQLCKESAARS